MVRSLCFFVLICLLSGFLCADEIKMEDFPRGKWLDPVWKAYWVFSDDNIVLLDMKDKEIYNFAGIVTNMKVENLPSGTRMTFDCPQARRSYLFEKIKGQINLRMEITQVGNSIAYKMEMPTITQEELEVFKQITLEAAERKSGGPLLEDTVQQAIKELIAYSELADFNKLEELTLRQLSGGIIDEIISILEAEAAKTDAPPAVFIALSTLYGRLGFKTKEYAAINAAEAAVKPGVAFNIALVYGRKQLLINTADADSIFVGSFAITSEPSGAEVRLDGELKGVTPITLAKLKLGRRKITLSHPGYQVLEHHENLGAGQTIPVNMVLKHIEETKVVASAISMTYIPGGTFYMGSPAEEPFRSPSELQHLVRVSGFTIAKKETTQAEWSEIMGTNPSQFQNPASPVENVSWYEAIVYCNTRSLAEGFTPSYFLKSSNNPKDWGPIPSKSHPDWNKITCDFSADGYRLPTEAEWEFACRTGLTTPFSFGTVITTQEANFNGNFPYNGSPRGSYLMKTTAAGTYAANSWDIHDMHGNVSEWCWDVEGMYIKDMLDDPTGIAAGGFRVNRGGSWKSDAQSVRSAARNRNSAYFKAGTIGFRVVRKTR